MTAETPTDDEDERFDGHTHYFYDSGGHLYVDITAIGEQGRLELLPLTGGEVEVSFTQARISKSDPVLNFALTETGDDRLREYFGKETDGSAPETDAETTLLKVPADHTGVIHSVATTLKHGHARPEDLYFLPGVSDEEIAALRE